MREHMKIQRQKAGTSTVTNPSFVSPNIPTLASPTRGLGLQTNNAPLQTVTEVSTNIQKTQSADEQLLEPQAIKQKPLSHDISRITLRHPQAELTVSEPGDKYEQEADMMATQVMSMPDSAVQREMTPEETEKEVQTKPLAAVITPLVQREAMPEEEEEMQTKPLNTSMQRNILQEEEVQTKSVLQRATDGSFLGGGNPLADDVRGFMEPRFGHDFSQVRIHTDERAVESAEALRAHAYTFGQDVVFGAGQYEPQSQAGKRLLAHELTHVVQQSGGTTGGVQAELEVSQLGDVAEQEADAVADQVVAGESVQVQAKQDTTIARDEDKYADVAYGIMNSSMDSSDRVQSLVDASNRDLAFQGVPPVALGQLPADSPNLGEGNFTNWSLDINLAAMSTDTPEGRADAANTVGHEAYHLYQWYEMARLQAGLGESTEGIVPSTVGVQAASNPILQSDEHTHRVEEWYDSLYGRGANYRKQVLGNYIEDEAQGISMPMDRHAEYCQLPEERDAWNRGLEVTERYRQLEGLPNPPLASDPAICSPDEDAVCR